jgi:hypothetical protein
MLAEVEEPREERLTEEVCEELETEAVSCVENPPDSGESPKPDIFRPKRPFAIAALGNLVCGDGVPTEAAGEGEELMGARHCSSPQLLFWQKEMPSAGNSSSPSSFTDGRTPPSSLVITLSNVALLL